MYNVVSLQHTIFYAVAPQVVTAPGSQVLMTKTNDTIVCLVTAGIRNVEWKRNNQTIAHSNGTVADHHYRILPSGSLFVFDITQQDDGLYSCKVSNKAGEDSREIRVKVVHKASTKLLATESS